MISCPRCGAQSIEDCSPCFFGSRKAPVGLPGKTYSERMGDKERREAQI